MADSTPDQPRTISPRELDEVLGRARAERWRELSVVGPEANSEYENRLLSTGWPAQHVFQLSDLVVNLASKVAALTDLTSLDLSHNGIGDEGARALAALTNLTSLDLGNNAIGAEGARALAALINLTSLDLGNNAIGAEGARALAALTNLTSLNLAGNSIGDEGARALAALNDLTSLTVWSNSIGAEGARALAGLTSLTWLDLGINKVGDEGARALAALTNLTSLNVEDNSIGPEGARVLAALTNLTSLDLDRNTIGAEGACALSRLISIERLNLWNNQIGDDGARALTELPRIRKLTLWKNNISAEGARALAALSDLTLLDLDENNIGPEGARALIGLTNLTSLYLKGNGIGAEGVRALLDAWVDAPTAKNLWTLQLRENGDLSAILPAEVLHTVDAQAILAAYRRFRAAARQRTLRTLDEAKLLVVGAEAVGKTSLVRYLVESKPRDPNEPKTPGIPVHEKIETHTWSPEGGRVRLNVWDFGGQEIMHGTHHFFLTERSLYLLVLWDRLEDDRSVYDWLRSIRNRGGDSPVIVVINKCDDGVPKLRLEETRLRREHPAILGFLYTSCDPGERAAASIAGLRQLIAATLAGDERLKHVRDPIPQSWLRVKDAVRLRAREQRVLPLDEFKELCKQRGGEQDDVIADPDEQRAVLRLLHDLGVVVAHGLRRDAPAALREVTLLDPNWLTGAIYSLLNSATVRDQGGEFSRAQMRELLNPQLYPPDWHEFILDMMQDPDVGLCFEILGSRHERYLIPEALPANEPDYGIWPADSLRFRFRYDFLPRRLIPRFIVQTHRNLTEKPTRWRTGVVLSAAGCKVLVRGERDRNRIDISVSGPEGLRRSALNVVLDDLDEVHRVNPEIGAKALVPLTDEPELDVSYDHLLKLEQRYGLDHEFDPEDAARSYTVRELLEGVRREPSRRIDPDEHRKGYLIEARDHARVTVVDRGFHGGDREPRHVRPAPAGGGGSWLSWFSSWRFFSVACGAAAVAVAIIIWLLPTPEWRAIVGGLIGLSYS